MVQYSEAYIKPKRTLQDTGNIITFVKKKLMYFNKIRLQIRLRSDKIRGHEVKVTKVKKFQNPNFESSFWKIGFDLKFKRSR